MESLQTPFNNIIFVGISPQGTISFVSPCVCGRMSDKEIVEKSQLMEHLLPGKVVCVCVCVCV